MSENLNTFCVLVNTVHDSVFIQFSFDIVTVCFFHKPFGRSLQYNAST